MQFPGYVGCQGKGHANDDGDHLHQRSQCPSHFLPHGSFSSTFDALNLSALFALAAPRILPSGVVLGMPPPDDRCFDPNGFGSGFVIVHS